jgi:cobalt-zinc-cadmium efflux system outer membrane protein
VAAALRDRPDVRLARLEERVADAGHRLARAEGRPDVAAFGRVSVERSAFDETPVGALRDRDTTLEFGVSVSLPLFDRNQGGRAEAATAVAQARRRREFAEARARAEVLAAYARYRAAESAVATFEGGVLARTEVSVEAIRGAYQVGAYRVTELLAEQRRLVDAEREYTDALAERYRALAELEAAVGVAAPAEYAPPAPPATRAGSGAPAAKYPGLAPGAVEVGPPAPGRGLPTPLVGPEDPVPSARATRGGGPER